MRMRRRIIDYYLRQCALMPFPNGHLAFPQNAVHFTSQIANTLGHNMEMIVMFHVNAAHFLGIIIMPSDYECIESLTSRLNSCQGKCIICNRNCLSHPRRYRSFLSADQLSHPLGRWEVLWFPKTCDVKFDCVVEQVGRAAFPSKGLGSGGTYWLRSLSIVHLFLMEGVPQSPKYIPFVRKTIGSFLSNRESIVHF